MNKERFDELSDELDRIVEPGERVDPPEEVEEDAYPGYLLPRCMDNDDTTPRADDGELTVETDHGQVVKSSALVSLLGDHAKTRILRALLASYPKPLNPTRIAESAGLNPGRAGTTTRTPCSRPGSSSRTGPPGTRRSMDSPKATNGSRRYASSKI